MRKLIYVVVLFFVFVSCVSDDEFLNETFQEGLIDSENKARETINQLSILDLTNPFGNTLPLVGTIFEFNYNSELSESQINYLRERYTTVYCNNPFSNYETFIITGQDSFGNYIDCHFSLVNIYPFNLYTELWQVNEYFYCQPDTGGGGITGGGTIGIQRG